MEEIYIYATYALLAFVILSEILPFLKKTKGNGLVHSVIECIHKSEDLVETVTEIAEAIP